MRRKNGDYNSSETIQWNMEWNLIFSHIVIPLTLMTKELTEAQEAGFSSYDRAKAVLVQNRDRHQMWPFLAPKLRPYGLVMRVLKGRTSSNFWTSFEFFGETTFDLMEDSQPAINAQRENVSSSKFRHIKIKYHYIRQLILDGWCKLVKIC